MKNLIWWLFAFLLLSMGMLQSCTTERKALNYLQKHPEVGAVYCNDKHPVKEVFIKGKDSVIEKTVTVKGDSVDCPPQIKGKDTIRVKVKCPDQKVIYQNVYRTDTLVKENTAKSAILGNELDKVNKSYLEEKILREKAEKEARTRLWYLIGLMAIVGAYVVLKIKKVLPF